MNHHGHGRFYRVWDCVISLESGWNPYAVGAAGERGLVQAHPIWASVFDWSRMFEVEYNVLAGIEIWRRAGGSWRPWSVAWRCV